MDVDGREGPGWGGGEAVLCRINDRRGGGEFTLGELFVAADENDLSR